MSQKKEDTVVRDGVEYEEVSHDDAVIGKALKVSAGVLVAAGAVGGALWWLNTRPDEITEAQKSEVDAPVAVTRDVVAPAVHFTDVTAEAGLTFVHQNGAEGDKLLPETMGGGSAFFDLENDGDSDLLLVNGCYWPGSAKAANQPTQALYANDGKGRFTDVTAPSGLAVSFYGMGAAAADADADGDSDLFFTAVGPNHYFAAENGAFVARDVGVSGTSEAWSSCATFFDADKDGDLDLYVGNYVKWSREIDQAVGFQLTGIGRAYGPPTTFEGTQPYFYRNDGKGSFQDETAPAGFEVVNPATGVPVGKALGARACDADLDGDMDLAVANDTVANFFYRNAGNGTFEERAKELGLAFDRDGRSTGAMGIDAAWFRNDDALAIAIGNFANEMSSFYVSQGRADLWADEAIGSGIGAPTRKHLSFGALFLDYDLDGRVDFLQANGHLENEINQVQSSQHYEQPAQLFWNAGPDAKRTYVEVVEGAGDLGRPIVGRGASACDIDGDGDLDLLLTQSGGKPELLRNDQALGNSWLRLRLTGKGSNHAALGARVELHSGGVKQCQELVPFRSYLSQCELVLTFGLGKSDKAERIVVFWPDGTHSEWKDLAANREHALAQP